MLQGILASVGGQFIHHDAVVPFKETDSVGDGRIESAAGTIGVNGTPNLGTDCLFGYIGDIHLRPVDAANHGQLPFGDTLNLNNIILCDGALPEH